MHSGPVTAGVLRGDRARFQLFGDTVNTGTCPEDATSAAMDNSNIWSTERLPTTASRIESTGMRERIHLSEQTAMELTKHGKQDWMVRRDDTVEAKGKGELVTYWLKLNSDRIGAPSTVASSEWGGTEGEASERAHTLSDLAHAESYVGRQSSAGTAASRKKLSSKANQKIQRLVDWNSELLLPLLKRVVARRSALQSSTSTSHSNLTAIARNIGVGSMVVNEVAAIIEMPAFVSANCIADVQVSDDVAKQLHGYVAKIASMYNNNPCKCRVGHGNGIISRLETTLTRICISTYHSLSPQLRTRTFS